ncbi:DNA repair protein RecO [Candidatus Berkelbacteria bacterium RIFOXYA2_FULL_43_10]|uniref:DNA repair protein RecO n=1 Tax=Candidatus Berkelbacteria bacterium RIFOXYA2_FULL_43_10 TaxID=1797472 RepID=A0A1F5EEJ4_9BACT|nr:MAG: DNA repair protein RecO [Candidatus Berkelbacteria bacterium RIFOXYA2_FULL_43_10]
MARNDNFILFLLENNCTSRVDTYNMVYKTSGIVLKRKNFGEADRVLTILTERFGKISAIAKGSRKIKAKLLGHLEPFTQVNFQFHEGRNFYIVTSADIVHNFENIHNDYQKTTRAFYLGELCDKFLESDEKNIEVYRLLSSALEYLEDNNVDLMLRFFELKIIEASGFKPALRECVHCRKILTAGSNFWDQSEGGIICSDCQKKFQHGKKISDGVIKLLRVIEEKDIENATKIKQDNKIEAETEEILDLYIKNILERELKSKRMMKQ